MRQAGFTLVEMLIALAIFGMLTAAGVTLLSFSVRAQESADRRLAESAELRRAIALLSADFAQAVPRRHRGERGEPLPAFAGGDGSDPDIAGLVRSGWDNPDGAPRASLQRIAYRLESGRLERIAFAHVDGAAPLARIVLIDGLTGLRLRYRDRDGEWRPRWDPLDATDLPRAVELVADTPRHGTLRLLFRVGP